MKPIHNSFNEQAFEYTTESGLKVVLVHRPGFKRSIAAYGSAFGALALKQQVNGVEVVHKTGVAHFLEHKLFEDETGDVFSKFASCGASANAFTSYDQTLYYFSTNGDVVTPLGILIDFVGRFNLTQKQVDKEKGIILEELKMYAKMPDTKLFMKTYQNVYHNFPMRIDIGGTEEDVRDMLLDDLQTAYTLNYSDNNMGLVVVSGHDLNEIKTVIDAHTQTHSNQDYSVKTIFEPEPLTVLTAYEEIEGNVLTPKMTLSYKFAYHGNQPMVDEYCIRLLLDMNFSEINDDYQGWLDQQIISDSFNYDVDLRDGFGVVYFFNEGDTPDKFKETIDAVMHNLVLSPEAFAQLSKRHYGQIIMSLERMDRFAINILTSSFKNVNYLEYLEKIRHLEYSQITQCLSILNEYSTSFLVMKPGV